MSNSQPYDEAAEWIMEHVVEEFLNDRDLQCSTCGTRVEGMPLEDYTLDSLDHDRRYGYTATIKWACDNCGSTNEATYAEAYGP